MENHVEELKAERDNLLKTQQKVESENSTLRRDLSSKEQDSKKRQSTLEERIRELETNIKLVQQNGSVGSQGRVWQSNLSDFGTNFIIFDGNFKRFLDGNTKI